MSDMDARITHMNQRIDFIWGDLYGDERRDERGMVGDIKSLSLTINRLSVVLVFFAIIALLNLLVLVWVVLSL